MRTLRFLVLSAVIVGSVLAPSSVAADNGATTYEFEVSYGYFVLGETGSFTCSETRIEKTAPKAFIKESATCIVTGDYTPGTYPAVGNWYSDYEYFIDPGGGFIRLPIKGDIEIVANADGTTTWYVTSYY